MSISSILEGKKHFFYRVVPEAIKRDDVYRLFAGEYERKGFPIQSFPPHAVVSITIDLPTQG